MADEAWQGSPTIPALQLDSDYLPCRESKEGNKSARSGEGRDSAATTFTEATLDNPKCFAFFERCRPAWLDRPSLDAETFCEALLSRPDCISGLEEHDIPDKDHLLFPALLSALKARFDPDGTDIITPLSLKSVIHGWTIDRIVVEEVEAVSAKRLGGAVDTLGRGGGEGSVLLVDAFDSFFANLPVQQQTLSRLGLR